MDVAGSLTVARPRSEVWTVFQNPVELAACVPGVEGVEVVDDGHYEATMVVKVSFMTLRFAVHGELVAVQQPEHMEVELNGEPASLAGAFQAVLTVDFAEEGDGTRLSYQVNAHMAGRLASLGEALLNSTATALSAEFAANLKRRLELERV